MINKLLSYLYIAYFFASSAFLVWIAAAITLFTKDRDPNRRLVHRYACWWAFHYIKMNPFWKCTFEGLDNIDPNKAYVLISNHQSYWDIMVLYGLYKPYKWVSKEEIFKVPFIGWNMYLNQYVKLVRGDLKSIKEMLTTCRNWLKQGASIMIFPEGTRSLDGELIEFRDGPFKIAHDCKVPLIPIVVDGTHGLLPKHSLEVNFVGKITVKVLTPVNPEDFESIKQFRDHVRELMKTTLAEIRSQKASPPLIAKESNQAAVR
jgi:1-acyl-sn-glycerol-3-phosphate acyltransferase